MNTRTQEKWDRIKKYCLKFGGADYSSNDHRIIKMEKEINSYLCYECHHYHLVGKHPTCGYVIINLDKNNISIYNGCDGTRTNHYDDSNNNWDDIVNKLYCRMFEFFCFITSKQFESEIQKRLAKIKGQMMIDIVGSEWDKLYV